MEKLLIGTYTRNNESQGIYRYDVTQEFHYKNDIQRAIENPIYFTLNQTEDRLVSITKTDQEGGIALFAIDPNAERLTLLDISMQSDVGACDICLSKNERFVITAHYGAGRLEVHEIIDGKKLQLKQVIEHRDYARGEQKSRVHFARLMEDGNLVVCDLGLDKIFVYDFSEITGEITPTPKQIVKTRKGSGPRNFVANANQDKLYVINELDTTVDIFDYQLGVLRFVSTVVSVSEYQSGMSGAAIKLTSSGKYLYISIRGGNREPNGFEDNYLVAFEVLVDGSLKKLEQVLVKGNHPRDFEISAADDKIYVANQLSNNITIFKIEKVGTLSFTGMELEVPAPVCIKVLK